MEKGREGCSLWMGCPVIAEKLLCIVQLRVTGQCTSWAVPPAEMSIEIVNDLNRDVSTARKALLYVRGERGYA